MRLHGHELIAETCSDIWRLLTLSSYDEVKLCDTIFRVHFSPRFKCFKDVGIQDIFGVRELQKGLRFQTVIELKRENNSKVYYLPVPFCQPLKIYPNLKLLLIQLNSAATQVRYSSNPRHLLHFECLPGAIYTIFAYFVML